PEIAPSGQSGGQHGDKLRPIIRLRVEDLRVWKSLPLKCRSQTDALLSRHRWRLRAFAYARSFPPILFGFPFHSRCIRVLHFEPIRRAAGTVDGILPLRHDAFETELAGMGEDARAVAFDMLVEPDAGASLGQHARKRGLADLKRIAPQVVAIQLDQVEGVEEYALVSAVVTDEIERGNAVVIAGDSFTIDNAGPRA